MTRQSTREALVAGNYVLDIEFIRYPYCATMFQSKERSEVVEFIRAGLADGTLNPKLAGMILRNPNGEPDMWLFRTTMDDIERNVTTPQGIVNYLGYVEQIEEFQESHGYLPTYSEAKTQERSMHLWLKTQINPVLNREVKAECVARLEALPGWNLFTEEHADVVDFSVISRSRVMWTERFNELASWVAQNGGRQPLLKAEDKQEHYLRVWLDKHAPRFVMEEPQWKLNLLATLPDNIRRQGDLVGTK